MRFVKDEPPLWPNLGAVYSVIAVVFLSLLPSVDLPIGSWKGPIQRRRFFFIPETGERPSRSNPQQEGHFEGSIAATKSLTEPSNYAHNRRWRRQDFDSDSADRKKANSGQLKRENGDREPAPKKNRNVIKKTRTGSIAWRSARQRTHGITSSRWWRPTEWGIN